MRQLIVHLLKKADYEVVFERVETAENRCVSRWKNRTWDIVISDYSLPAVLTGAAALNC